ncbi:MAG: response regulator [Desulfobulbus sp.]
MTKKELKVTGPAMNILIVDDEAMLLQSIQIGLQNRGYCVVTATSGEQALGYLHDNGQSIDLVVTDYLMPGMNGIQFLILLRNKYPDMPTLFMTAYADTKMVIDAFRHRCDGFMQKPFSLQQLVEEIEGIKERSNKPDR